MNNSAKIANLFAEMERKYGKLPLKKDADLQTVAKEWEKVIGNYNEESMMIALSKWFGFHSKTVPSPHDLKIHLDEKFLDKKKEVVEGLPSGLQDGFDMAQGFWKCYVADFHQYNTPEVRYLKIDLERAFWKAVESIVSENKSIWASYDLKNDKIATALCFGSDFGFLDRFNNNLPVGTLEQRAKEYKRGLK